MTSLTSSIISYWKVRIWQLIWTCSLPLPCNIITVLLVVMISLSLKVQSAFGSSAESLSVHRKVAPSIKFAGTNFYTWVGHCESKVSLKKTYLKARYFRSFRTYHSSERRFDSYRRTNYSCEIFLEMLPSRSYNNTIHSTSIYQPPYQFVTV